MSMEYEWVSVEGRPLFVEYQHMGVIIITDDGEKEFFAAVPYNDKSKPGENLWWVRHCIIEDGILCVVGDDYNEPAGWELKDVTHWMPIPPPPSIK